LSQCKTNSTFFKDVKTGFTITSYDLFPPPKSSADPHGIYATDQGMLVDPPPFGTVYRNMKIQITWDEDVFFRLTYLQAEPLKIKSVDVFNCTLYTGTNKGSVMAYAV
jgi:hypothetical protein